MKNRLECKISVPIWREILDSTYLCFITLHYFDIPPVRGDVTKYLANEI